MTDRIPFATIGIDHPHAIHQNQQLLASGRFELVAFHGSDDEQAAAFRRLFPDARRAMTAEEILADPAVKLVNCAAVNSERADIAAAAMRAGKDVLTDKPGVTTFDQLDEVQRVQADTKRHWYIWFGERLSEPATVKAAEVVASGRIGRVVQTVGLGPHRQGENPRAPWFYEKRRYGGILVDILSHQIDQFLFFTGSTEAEVLSAQIGNFANPDHPELEDFGDITLTGNGGSGYARVDWMTPAGLGVWGDGRLFILGTKGYIEVRKFVDIAGRPGGGHLFVVDGEKTEYIDCDEVTPPFADDLAHDIVTRENTAISQEHCFLAARLQLTAERDATRVGPFGR